MENKKITFKRHYFFGGDKKAVDPYVQDSDWIDYYMSSNGHKIDVCTSWSDWEKWYKIDNNVICDTLKEAKEYIIRKYGE